MNAMKPREENNLTMLPAEEPEIGALEALWKFFSSMKTAIWLLLLLAVASIAGTVLEDRMGVVIYRTAWFSVLLVLVGINLAVCSINRFGLVWRRTFHPDVNATPQTIALMTRSESVSSSDSPEAVAEKATRALRSRSYQVISQESGSGISVYATKGRAALWGAHLTHLSLLVVFIGAVIGHMVGFDGFVAIVEGKHAHAYTRDGAKEESPLGFDVALRNFNIKYDKNRNPIGYKSDLQVIENGKPVVSKLVDVNHPLTYKGITFYQADYGLVGLVIKVTGPDGKVVRVPYNIRGENTPQGRAYAISDEPFRTITVNGKKLTLFVHNLVPDYVGGEKVNASMLPLNPAVEVMANDRFPERKALEDWTRMGWMTVNKPATYKGNSITLEKVYSYSGLQVSRDPALPIVYTGFALMVLGVILSFYVTHRIIRLRISPSSDGTSVSMGATSRAEPSVFDKDMKHLREALGQG